MAHLRHLSVKIWISIFFWILIAVWTLPLIQKIVGVRWLVVPAIFIFLCVYVVAGRLMEHFALAKFNHLLKEAGVMERAGMTKESSQALAAAVDLFESDETLIPTEFSATIFLNKKEHSDQEHPLTKQRTDVADAFRAVITRMRGFVNKLSQIEINSGALSMARGAVVVIILMGGLFLTLHLVNSIFKNSDKPETSSSNSADVHNDPFTLQVGAYLNQQDAKRQVRELRKKNLNAYLTEAQSRDRKWYQVRISHFEDRHQAKTYGESLKSKGVISDYYVANYRTPLNATEATNSE